MRTNNPAIPNSVLITGGTGYLGHGLVERLLQDGYQRICVYSRGEAAQAAMRRRFDDPRMRWFVGDVRDKDRLCRAMQGVDLVIHAAALKRIEVGAYNPDEMVKTNVGGTMNVIAAARETSVRRAVLVSSDKAFEPVSPYGQTKALAESLFLTANEGFGPEFTVCRYGNVAGSTGSVIPVWREELARPDNSARGVRMTDPECTRFWMSRDEAVSLVLSTLHAGSTGEVVIPELPAYRLHDLAVALGAQAVQVTGLGAYEKRHESMCAGRSSDRARRMTVDELREQLEVVA